MPQRSSDTDDVDKVRVEVRGATMEDLKHQAKRVAAEFFGVDPEFATLSLGGMLAVPVIREGDGSVSLYRAEIVVRLAPIVQEPGERDESRTAHRERPAVSVPSRRPRPAGPAFDDDDDELDEDEDGLSEG